MKQYRNKPVVIEAVQYTQYDADLIVAGFVDSFHGLKPHVLVDEEGHYHRTGKLLIKTRESDDGRQLARPGDWIITGVQGERYPCRPGIFAETYEEVEETVLERPPGVTR